MDFTNLVLAVVLPACSEFANRLDLPLPLPLATNQLKRFQVDRVYPELECDVVLTNGYLFTYQYGHVRCYTSPMPVRKLFLRRDAKDYWQAPTMTEHEVVAFCREKVLKLGYREEELYLDTEPEVKRLSPFPNYEVTWYVPFEESGQSLAIEVDTVNRRIVELYVFGVRRPEPDIPGLAELRLQKKQAQEQQNPACRKERVPKDDPRVLEALPKIKAFARGLELPFEGPEGPQHLQDHCDLDYEALYPSLGIGLTNGYRFSYDLLYKRVHAFDDGRPFFDNRPVVRWRNYLGQWRLTEAAAIALVRDAARKAGWKVQDLLRQRPRVQKPNLRGPYTVPRYYFAWERGKGGVLDQAVYAEVDAEAGRVVGLGLQE